MSELWNGFEMESFPFEGQDTPCSVTQRGYSQRTVNAENRVLERLS